MMTDLGTWFEDQMKDSAVFNEGLVWKVGVFEVRMKDDSTTMFQGFVAGPFGIYQDPNGRVMIADVVRHTVLCFFPTMEGALQTARRLYPLHDWESGEKPSVRVRYNVLMTIINNGGQVAL